MEKLDPSLPIFTLHVGGVHVATLFDPKEGEMFWCTYRLEPVDEQGDAVIHDEKTWKLVNFTVKDSQGVIPAPNTFTGSYGEFCGRQSDRLSFRSLWPPEWRPPDTFFSRLKARLNSWLCWAGFQEVV